MKVAVLEAEKVAYRGNAKEAVLPGEEGEFSVLDFHQDFLACLKEGVVRLIESVPKSTANEPAFKGIKIAHGIAKMIKNELVILVETIS